MYSAEWDRKEGVAVSIDSALFSVVPHGEYPSEIVPSPEAIPGPSRWQPLHDALRSLADADLVRVEHTSFVYVVLDVDPEEWTRQVADRAYSLITSTYRDTLEDLGWDVDLLPEPDMGPPAAAPGYQARRSSHTPATEPGALPDEHRPTPAPGPAAPAAAATVTLTPTSDGKASLWAPVDHPLRTLTRDIPGAYWNGSTSTWDIPVTHRTALALRKLLTGHRVTLDRTLAARLKEAADAPPVPDLIVNGERIEIRFEHTARLQEDVKRFAKATWDGDNGCWVTELGNAAGALKFADTHKLFATKDVVDAAEKRNEPFDYDGTIDGLRGVPVSELNHVQASPARGQGKKRTPSLEERLADYGIESLYDILMTIPLRYMDRSRQIPIRDLKVGEQVGFLGRVTKIGQYDRMKRMIRFTVADATGDLSITFFNAPWMQRRFRVGDEVVVYGRLDVWSGGGRRILQMTNPIMDPVGDDTAMIVPVYPQSEKSKVTTWDIHGAAMEAIRRLGDLQDPLPGDIKARHDLMDRLDAYKQVHHPDSLDLAARARTRLAFDELFRMQLALGMRRYATADETGVVHKPTGVLSGQFLAGLPFPLTGAQQRAIGEITEDLKRPYPMHRLLQGDVGAGKAQPLDSLVLTPAGYKRMGDMRVGDTVVTPSGEHAPVTGVFPQGERDIYRLTFSDGTSVEADDEHLWAVNTSTGWYRDTSLKTLTTRELRESLLEKNGASRWHLPNIVPVDLGGEGRPLDPYFLGALLGDGGFSTQAVTFTNEDKVIVDYVREVAESLGCELVPASAERGIHYRFAGKVRGKNRVTLAVRFLDLMGHNSHTKFIPDAYKNAPVAARLALLQGLMDTDGEVGHKRDPDARGGSAVAITLASERLIDDIAWIVYSLGGRAKKGVVEKTFRRADGSVYRGTYYRLGITMPNEMNPFRMGRKADSVAIRTKYAHRRRAIRSIEYVGKKPAQCIMVDHPDHMYVTDNFTPTHNTVMASLTLLAGLEGGYQGALMAPTEILASQLFAELRDELAKIEHPDGRPLVVDFLAAKTRAKEKRRILAGLADGSVDLVVGTHALLVEEVEFANLGVVVIDEQHRFGVEQRAALRAKGKNGAPDMLVMTATPIPRTSAMTVFGDLSMSTLDELPPGRTPIGTTWLQGEPELDVITGPPWDLVRREVEQGRQAYVVASLVEDNEKIAAASAEAALEALEAGALTGLRLGLVHGKQPREEREATMLAFKNGELDVLVATTVIEVGVNVPNATVMVILDATRFGIAQLHQIRGRVGRGKHVSHCVLTGKAGSQDAVIRMQALCESTDGFYLSEVDLDLRGEGSIFGSRQSGQTDLRVASLKDDREMVVTCRTEADRLLDGDPKLNRRPGLRTEVRSALGEDTEAWLNKS